MRVLWMPLLLGCTPEPVLPVTRTPPETETETALECGEAPALADLPDVWTVAGQAPGGDIVELASTPADPDLVLAASVMNGLYLSVDGGLTWEKQLIPTSHMAGQIAIHETDPSRAVATTGEIHRTRTGGGEWMATGWGTESSDEGTPMRGLLWVDDTLLALDAHGVLWSSSDDAQTFEEMATVAAGPPPPPGGDHNMFDIDQSWWYLGKSGSVLWAVHQGEALYRSVDGGESWEEVFAGAFNVTAFGADEEGAWAGGSGIFVRATETSVEELDVSGLEIAGAIRHGDGRFMVANDDATWLVTDDGFEPGVEPDGAHHVRHLHRLEDGDLVLSHQDGLLRSSDGEAWEISQDGIEVLDLGPLLPHPECPSWVWVGTTCERGLFFSSDWGETLTRVDEYFHYVMVGAVNLAEPQEMWFTTDDVVKKSVDAGVTWVDMEDEALDVHVHGLALSSGDPDVVLVGSVGSGEASDTSGKVYGTDDGGATWADWSEGLPQTDASVHALHVLAANPDIVMLGTFRGGDFTHSSGGPGIGIYRSTDAGRSWSLVETGAQDAPVFSECGDRLFASTDVGVLLSEDQGQSFRSVLEAEEPFLAVACDGDTVLAFEQSAMWRSDDGGAAWYEWSDGLDLSVTFPEMMPQVGFSGDGRVVYLAGQNLGLLRRAR
jgi:photosystem II stability/assembly factor-like uncharacterized protein